MKVKAYKTEKLITNIYIKNKETEIGGIEVQDPRINRIDLLNVDFKDDSKKMIVEMQDISSFETSDFKMIFLTPNNISILLYVYRNELKKYKLTLVNHVLKNDLGENYKDKDKLTYNSKMIYEMIQYAELSVIFGYTALEAFANYCIPIDYVYEIENSKGIIEKYDVYAIERWMTLSEKIKNVLCEVFEDSDILKTKYWSDFKHLEQIRNSIIHSKQEEYDFYHIFFDKKTISYLESIDSIIEYFINLNKEVDIPLNDFKGRCIFNESHIKSENVKNMQVNSIDKIETGQTMKLKDFLDNLSEEED